MKIHYHCRHCELELGSIPFESAREALRLVEKLDEKASNRFLVLGRNNELTVRSICEQCEQSLEEFPDFYATEKWLQ